MSYQDMQGSALAIAQPSGQGGRLILVVGPSGAGKDRLISAAKAQLSNRHDVYFIRREITRPANAGSEDHIAVSESDFEAHRRDGRYFLSWRAHGLGYGIPSEVAARLMAGVDVVANVSRGVIADARLLYPRTEVVLITASRDVLAARLCVRGREAAPDIERRLDQADKPLPHPADREVVNDGSFEAALHAFLGVFPAQPSGLRAATL
jgi:phosphonate metabolism protein PhnN/1,5-bisphosphokinase (PRPP-forming)